MDRWTRKEVAEGKGKNMGIGEEKNVKSPASMPKCPARKDTRAPTRKDSVQIDEALCSVCTICSSVCPLKAISTTEKEHKVKLDIEKCQACGICVSACPVSAIYTVYYDSDSLINYVKKSIRETGLNSLVLMCRSNSPLPRKVEEALGKQNLDESISLRLPCVGRVSPELLFKILASGIRKITIVPCEEDFCRFKEGSRIGTRRFKLIQALLDQLNLENALSVVRGLPRAHVETEKCISCGDCVEVCPEEAIQLKSAPRVAELNVDKCSGCGACVVVCPTLAVSIEGFEHKTMFDSISDSKLPYDRIEEEDGKPRILVLCCQWSEFSALDETRRRISKDNLLFMELPCAARVESLHILKALRTGFDGVFVAACRKDECRIGKGSERAERRILALKKLLSHVNLENRLEICFVSPRHPGEFNTHLDSFRKALTELGPLHLEPDKSMMLEAAIEALKFERPRLILERSQILLEKGNVFGEKVSQEEFGQMLKPIEGEFMRRRIVLSLGENALSVKEIAKKVKVSPGEVLRNMISLERDGLVSVQEIEGNSPRYRTTRE
jgi:coenzyme F420-reducing hydrogenase delta subunit/NAD-dependent dihydropyrimidine dehydrogenase PreA subunit